MDGIQKETADGGSWLTGGFMRDSFIFYRSFYEAIRDLPRDIQGEIYTAIMEYGLYGNETESLKPIARSIFMLVKHYIDRQGRQGGFKGADSDENKLIRNSKLMRQWRKAVFKRDNYTCRICGQHGGKLNAHHVKCFSLYRELRLDVGNGITLCEKCHNNIHKTEREWEKTRL